MDIGLFGSDFHRAGRLHPDHILETDLDILDGYIVIEKSNFRILHLKGLLIILKRSCRNLEDPDGMHIQAGQIDLQGQIPVRHPFRLFEWQANSVTIQKSENFTPERGLGHDICRENGFMRVKVDIQPAPASIKSCVGRSLRMNFQDPFFKDHLCDR